MKKDIIIEEKILRAWNGTIGRRYNLAVDDEMENRREYYDDIRYQKKELREDTYIYVSKVEKQGIDDGSIKIENKYLVPLNEEGKKKIKLINEAYDELNENLESVESCYFIEESFDCSLNSESRCDYVEIVDMLINFNDITQEELKQQFMNALLEETLELNNIEKEITIKAGELFITSILERNLNSYDNKVDDILYELI